MAVVYSSTLKDTRMNAVVTDIDAGASPGKLVIGDATLSGPTGVLATITLDDPSATVTSGVLTLASLPLSAVAAASGTAAKAELRDSDDNVVVSGLTVGVGSEDIVMNTVTITIGQSVVVNTGTITHG